MRTLILTLLVLIAAPSVASAGLLHLKKQPGELPKPIALKHGADPQNPKPKHKLLHKHRHGHGHHGCDDCGHGHGGGLFHRHR